MSAHNTESVTGLLDGELKGLRLWLVKRHVGTCPICAVEYRRQLHVRRVLQENPPTATMSDSPEFFWSKVKSEIQRRGQESIEVPQPRLALSDWMQRHQFAMATVTALVIAACGVIWFMQTDRRSPAVTASVPAVKPALPTVTASLPTVTPPLAVVTEVLTAVTTAAAVPTSFTEVEQLKTPVPHAAATSFDSEDGVTVIWVTGLPWTSDMTEMETAFANMDT